METDQKIIVNVQYCTSILYMYQLYWVKHEINLCSALKLCVLYSRVLTVSELNANFVFYSMKMCE